LERKLWKASPKGTNGGIERVTTQKQCPDMLGGGLTGGPSMDAFNRMEMEVN
jgi:hypothetical protein